MTFHAKAWLAWFVAALTVTLAIDNPFAHAAIAAAAISVAAAFRSAAPEGRAVEVFLKIGLAFLAFRILLFGLTGHTGPTTLFTLPRAALPSWLGGFSVGGRVTGEVIAQQVAEGLEITAVLVVVGTFLSVVDTYRILRLLPRFLFEAGLIVSIALTFVPCLLESATEIRDAQRLRGHRFRGVRALRALVVPVLEGALERSLTLAASMEVRGYGRARPASGVGPSLAVIAGLLTILAGGVLLMFGRGPAVGGASLGTIGAAIFVAGLRRAGRRSERTIFRPDAIGVWDRVLVTTSLALVVAGLAARATAAAHWYPYPEVAWPPIDARLVALAIGLAAPIAVDRLRRARIRRASARQPLTPQPETLAPQHASGALR